jgi:hypothetical protein
VANLQKPNWLVRHWALGATITVWVLSAVAVLNGGFRSEALDEGFRLIVALVGVGLLAYQWQIYRKNIGGIHLAFLSAVLFALSVPAIWLGLNVVRFYSYAADNPDSTSGWIHEQIIHVQETLVWLGVVVIGVSVVLGISDLLRAKTLQQRNN